MSHLERFLLFIILEAGKGRVERLRRILIYCNKNIFNAIGHFVILEPVKNQLPFGGPCKLLKMRGPSRSQCLALVTEALDARPTDIVVTKLNYDSPCIVEPLKKAQYRFSHLRNLLTQYRFILDLALKSHINSKHITADSS
jgi:hypothetical protein